MRRIIFIVLIFATCIFSSKSSWTDENGCTYELSRIQSASTEYSSYSFEFEKLNKNFFKLEYGPKLHLNVFCKKKEDYCKTINDSIVKNIMPSLKKRQSLCKEKSKNAVNAEMQYSYPTQQSEVDFLCDFVKVNYEKEFFEVLDVGSCPVRVKGQTIGPLSIFINLDITKKGKSFKIEKKELLFQTRKKENPLSGDTKRPLKNDFFTVGYCAESSCEILNYLDSQMQDFDIKCDFIKRIDNRPDEVIVLNEGVCPIEILDKNKEKKVYYVRSVKAADGYKLLITNKRK